MNGCKKCPAYESCTVTYRGSSCAAIRWSFGLEEDPEIITNADKIRAMSDVELAALFARILTDEYAADCEYELTAVQLRALHERLYQPWMRWLQQPAEATQKNLII